MPYQTPCPKCAHVGLVRLEHVIKGGVSKHAFYCGSCEHTWETIEGEPSAAAVPRRRYRRPRVHEIRGGRPSQTRRPASDANAERMARIDQIIQKLTQTQLESAAIQQHARRALQTIARRSDHLALDPPRKRARRRS